MAFFATGGDGEILDALSKTDVRAIGAAKSRAELEDIAAPVLGLKKLSFSFLLPAVGLCLAVLWAVLLFAVKNAPEWTFFVTPVLAVACFVLHGCRTGRRDRVLRAVLLRAAMLDNGMEYGCGIGSRDLLSSLSREFESFSVGDEDREITLCASGRMGMGDGEEVSFNAYTFKYVVVRYTTDAKGRTRKTRETRRHYCLHLPEFKYAPPLDIRSSYGRQWPARSRVKWTTEMVAFNKKYKVACSEMTECAKFLSPAVVLAYQNAAERLGDLSMESRGSGALFVSKDADMLALPIRVKKFVDGSILLKDALQKDLNFPNLDVMGKLVREIKRFNDSNF